MRYLVSSTLARWRLHMAYERMRHLASVSEEK